MPREYFAIGIFLLSYVLFVVLPARRTIIALGAAFLLVLTGALPLSELPLAINWNVMGIFIGTLAVADLFMASRVPAFIAEKFVDKTKNTAWAMLFICVLTGVISAFVENVATVLIVAPIALELSRKIKLNPSALLIGIAVSSNLQGTATLIGDPPSMLLGGFAHMNFMDFFVYHGRPSIFFAVELGALFSFVLLFLIFRRNSVKHELIQVEKVKSWFPTILLGALIVLLAGSSFFDTGFSYAAGIICMAAGIVAVVWKKVVWKSEIGKTLKSYDWDTTLFLLCIFILVGSLTETGWIDRISEFLAGVVGSNTLLGFILIVSVSVALSAFIDNVPYLAAMLPVAMNISMRLGIEPPLLLFGLLIGASLGGNITPIGASANIVACGLLKKEGHPVKFGQFAKIGLPFTIAAVVPASIFIWLIWGR